MSDTILDRLGLVLQHASEHDPNSVVAPVAVLWPDENRRWESLVPSLRAQHPIASYGTFDAAAATGPAYWLRCVTESTIGIPDAPDGIPVIYLPGVSRDALSHLDDTHPDLAPLTAILHRCKTFDNRGRDWTIRSLLSNSEKGFGLNIAGDAATADALVASLLQLVDQTWPRLASQHIDAARLNGLLNPDPVRSLLDWIDDPVAMRSAGSDAAWSAFVQQCNQEFGFDPAASGEIEGTRRFGEAAGPWAQVWKRFRENPSAYPQIPDRLRAARPEAPGFFPDPALTWPQDNDSSEAQLRAQLLDLAALTPNGGRNELAKLESDHRARRGSVWADLDATPLANALEHLAAVATSTSEPVSGSSVSEIAEWYSETGWSADAAVIRAMGEVTTKADQAAVAAAITATYQPWLDESARSLQQAIGPAANGNTYTATAAPNPTTGEVVMFIDGLRLDVAHLLAKRLDGAGLNSKISTSLAALPTVTQTSKPALVPIDQTLLCAGEGLDARRAPDGASAGVQVLRSLLGDQDVQVLMGDQLGDPSGTAWTEAGKFDSRGHELGAAVVYVIHEEVHQVAVRIRELLDHGWAKITVVTDHGWLMLPNGLPKAELKPSLVELKKGRCARLKEGAAVETPAVPWHWDLNVRIALAPGVSCFEANQTYEHGGVSPQECVVPRIAVTSGTSTMQSSATITTTKWRGLTLVVEFTGLPEEARIDLRILAGDAASSIAEVARVTGGEGKVILLVGDEDLEGDTAQLVIVDNEGSILQQITTTVGQNR